MLVTRRMTISRRSGCASMPAGVERGGHDLRSWYLTRCIEDGGDSLIIRRTTHAPPKNVEGGYERFSWTVVCREVDKLRVELREPLIAELPADFFEASEVEKGRRSLDQAGDSNGT